MDSYNVQVHWDDEAKVWWADSKDIPGLIVEGDDIDELVKEACLAASLLIDMNNFERRNKLNFIYQRQAEVIFD
ncbi:MAG: DUF1902 domain-containing protein [Selenomonadaceae bacterium]|nr:DUF1902 domain-containing protein [Selenomonadaceae bacterium]